ncbi:unnamed protein product [Protopolystoma xenopodis]|uniref:Uncharacterized protein n=1 Tax=Protopolystoma xenopodis TaxID=117903 RepID=A0A448WZW0_9PLAT|nr:unnamed protein product [Protopolystoma xenopodis]
MLCKLNAFLQVELRTQAFGARHLIVSAVVWLVNQTGLPLVFTQLAHASPVYISKGLLSSTSPPRQTGASAFDSTFNAFSSNSAVNGETIQAHMATLAAGQQIEHEMARLVSPLLYSVASRTEKMQVHVRIGCG